MDFNALLEQATKLQKNMEEQENSLKKKEYKSETLKNIVQITMNGEYQVTRVHFDGEFIKNISADDKEIIEDAISIAVNELTEKITEDKENVISGVADMINIPGLR